MRRPPLAQRALAQSPVTIYVCPSDSIPRHKLTKTQPNPNPAHLAILNSIRTLGAMVPTTAGKSVLPPTIRPSVNMLCSVDQLKILFIIVCFR